MKKKITIEGMHCASCASNVERALKKIPKIKNVSVNILTNKAIIEGEDDADVDEIKKVISKIGYRVVKIE